MLKYRLILFSLRTYLEAERVNFTRYSFFYILTVF
jgi:hypothetical protein